MDSRHLARFETEVTLLGQRCDRVIVPVETSKEYLLGMQTAKSLAQLIVGPQVLRVNRVCDLCWAIC